MDELSPDTLDLYRAAIRARLSRLGRNNPQLLAYVLDRLRVAASAGELLVNLRKRIDQYITEYGD